MKVRGRVLWNCALVSAGALYLGLVLFQGIESPVFAVAFVMLAGFEIVHAHRAGR
jgi:hypothetical protein